jgi:hypothetical protein
LPIAGGLPRVDAEAEANGVRGELSLPMPNGNNNF